MSFYELRLRAAIRLEHVVDAGNKRAGAIGRRQARDIRVGNSPVVLIFADDLDVGADQNRVAGAEAVAGLIRGNAIDEVAGRIHEIVAHRADQPWIEPVVRDNETAGGSDRARRCDGVRNGVDEMIVVMRVQADSVEFKLAAIAETNVAADAVERF
jgi:hypothetical protein